MSVEHPPEDFVQRVLAGETSAEDVKWFERGMAMYWSNGGALSYERCLRLPATPSAMKRNTRNFWLCQAARLTTTCGVWKGPVALASALDRFITRGNWRQWQCLADPPAGAGDMDRALFFVAYNNGGEGLSIDYAILTEVRAFEYDAITGVARVDIFARIMNDRNGRVVTTRLFSSAATVPSDNAATVSAALDLALQDVLGQLVNWTLAAI